MSRKSSPSPAGRAQAPKRKFFTPLNVLALLIGTGAMVAVAAMQFAPNTPTPPAAASTPPASPTPAAPVTLPVTTGQTPSTTASTAIESRMIIAPPPDGTPVQGTPATVFEGITIGSGLPLFQTERPTIGLDPPAPGTRTPINAVDLFTSKATSYASPTKMHKGYVVAFCCANSGGYNGGGWDGLTEAEKDTYVRHFVKVNAGG